ncbi:MAG: hypothetical protein WBK99_01660 [Solirubrobacterales bacterium]
MDIEGLSGDHPFELGVLLLKLFEALDLVAFAFDAAVSVVEPARESEWLKARVRVG